MVGGLAIVNGFMLASVDWAGKRKGESRRTWAGR
jgi:hypothetical protein